MNIAFFGSSLVSAYWNATASYYRGIIRALHERGHSVTFFEPDAFRRRQYRDMEDPAWARLVVYRAEKTAVEAAMECAGDADVVIKSSGVGAFDELLEKGLLELRNRGRAVILWDVDAPATLNRIAADPSDPLIPLIPCYDAILTCGGGEPVVSLYKQWGARECLPVYRAMDSGTHFPVDRDFRYAADVAFLGDRYPDRESRVDEFLLKPAAALPQSRFLLAGSGWEGKTRPGNIRFIGHVFTDDCNAFNSTPRAILNITREPDVECGFYPPSQLFEAAGTGACVVTDAWEGIAQFFEPGEEVLVAKNGDDVVELVHSLTWAQAEKIGRAARQRVLWEHSYAQRAQLVEGFLYGNRASAPRALGIYA